MDQVTPRQLLEEELPRRFAAKAAVIKKLAAVIAFDIRGAQGGTWTLDATTPAATITPGTAGLAPKMVLVAKDTDFVAVATGKLSAVQAVMSGKLTFKPFDMTLALKLGELLS